MSREMVIFRSYYGRQTRFERRELIGVGPACGHRGRVSSEKVGS